jgi:GNAT superfamily N-acetyltransferase
MAMHYRFATVADARFLAELNHQLIRDEGHRNPMSVDQLEHRMRGWLSSGEYRAIIFAQEDTPVAYALYREDPDAIYLRQFFVVRTRRRHGIGRSAMQSLLSDIWPCTKRRTVSVLVQNTSGVAFWHAIGYQDYALTLEIMPSAPPHS